MSSKQIMNEIWCDEGNLASFCKVLGKFSYKNSRSIACLLDDIEFPTKAICYHQKTFHIGCLLCVEFSQVLLTLVKRFIMLPRLRSRTRLSYICCFYTGSTQKHALHPPQNVLLLHWEKTKICLLGFIRINAPNS